MLVSDGISDAILVQYCAFLLFVEVSVVGRGCICSADTSRLPTTMGSMRIGIFRNNVRPMTNDLS